MKMMKVRVLRIISILLVGSLIFPATGFTLAGGNIVPSLGTKPLTEIGNPFQNTFTVSYLSKKIEQILSYGISDQAKSRLIYELNEDVDYSKLDVENMQRDLPSGQYELGRLVYESSDQRVYLPVLQDGKERGRFNFSKDKIDSGFSVKKELEQKQNTFSSQEYLVNNSLINLVYDRGGYPEKLKSVVERFINAGHPFHQEIFPNVDRMSDEEIRKEANEYFRDLWQSGYLRNTVYSPVLDKVLSIRELLLRPSLGGRDFIQFITHRINPVGNYDILQEIQGEKRLKYDIKGVYLVLKTIEIVSRDKKVILMEKKDVGELLAEIVACCPEMSSEESSEDPLGFNRANGYKFQAKNFILFAKYLLPVDTRQKRESFYNVIALIEEIKARSDSWAQAFFGKKISEEFRKLKEIEKGLIDYRLTNNNKIKFQKGRSSELSNHKEREVGRQRGQSENFAVNVELAQIKKEKKLPFIALGTDWMKGYKELREPHLDALNKLLTSMRRFCKKYDIEFIEGEDALIFEKISKKKKDDFAMRGIVLAGEEIVEKIAVFLEKGDSERENSILLAGVSVDTNLSSESYLPIMEMLDLSVEIFRRGINDIEKIKQKHPLLDFKYIGKGRITFEPKAISFDTEEQRQIYLTQVFA